MSNPIGKTLLNRYRVDSFVASGGMGAVYKVWDLQRNVPLAMKILNADYTDDPSALKSFQREAQALEKLRHPNIVPFYGVHFTHQTVFILEQFIDGPSLREVLQTNPRGLPLSESLIYLKALCSALGYAHANRVVHCDIKPGNVMIDSGGQIYLADFGIARHTDSATTTLAGAGTPAYMAPEQIRGLTVNAATDIYALGALLFEILTGQRPFRGDEPGALGGATGERIRYAHLHLAPPDPSRINPSISRDLAKVILKALEKNPSQRYARTADFFQEFLQASGVSYDRIKNRLDSGGRFPKAGKADADFFQPDAPHRPVRKKRASPLIWITGGVFFLLPIILLLTLGSATTLKPASSSLPTEFILPLSNATTPTEALAPPIAETPTLFQNIDSPPAAAPTEMPAPAPTEIPPLLPTPTETRQNTSCPGAIPQEVSVGTRVVVCTYKTGERLIIRKKPGITSGEIFRVYPDSALDILDGPECLNGASWWKVLVPKYTRAAIGVDGFPFLTEEETVGWAREGDYNDPDFRFICAR